jgi:pimeloyl-ACP methyl ester carboxylesterase
MNIKYLILIGAILVTTVVGGWTLFHFNGGPAVVPEGAKAGDLLLKPCEVRFGSIRYQGDCGLLVVPENRADPASRLIALPVRRTHSSSANPGEPIFHLNGGPGTTNMGFEPPAWLLAGHDFIQVGYRGVDGTPKLDCPEVSRAITGVNGDLLSTPSLDNLSSAMKSCATRLQAEGTDLHGYTIPEVVEDMESVRKGLGYSRIDLLSESYGTRVAQVYAIMHPESLLRSVMIGVNPPGHFLWQPQVVDEQVTYYADLWRLTAGSSAPDLVGAMRSVNANMPNRWLCFPIDPGKVKMIAFTMLYHRTTAPLIFDSYLEAARGDPSGLALMTLAYDFLLPNMMTWGEFFAIGASADFETGRDYRVDLTTADAILGSPMSLLIWGSADGWPVSPMAEEYRQVHPTDVETLLISGSIDFSTPAQFAEQELLPYLRKGKHVVISEQGHTDDFWGFQSEATRRLLTSFYDTGRADDSLYTYLPMDFKPAMRFPLLVKILLVTGILVIIGLAWAAWNTVRRLARRKAVSAKQP